MRIMLYKISKTPHILDTTDNLLFNCKSNVKNTGLLAIMGIEPGESFYETKVLVDPKRLLFTDINMFNRFFGTNNGYSSQLDNCNVVYNKFSQDSIADNLIRSIKSNTVDISLTSDILKDIFVEGKLGISYPGTNSGGDTIIYNPTANKEYLTLVSETKYTRK